MPLKGMLRITDFSGSESGNIMAEVHPSAIIASGAVLGEGTSVGPYSIIGPNVVIGQNCQIGPHVVIEGFTSLGNDNRVFQFASVGSAPQDLKYKGEQSRLEIGSRNIIREYVTLQPGTAGGGMLSKIGDENLFMVSSHVGHDCRVGDKNVFANGVALAGHVQVGNGVILGGLSAIHQFVRLGDFALLSGGSMVSQDIPPFCLAQGDRASLVGLNEIGLKRNGFSEDDIKPLRRAFRILFHDKGPFLERQSKVEVELGDFSVVRELLAFARSSERGIASGRRKHSA